ncbi:hypothetical protein RD110_09895 [Rhodoferax koreense]|uniref:diguanylate cyclase n=1 Tax=Rhodoferax koreensis TaxID=1842727 RepID=A0A1P8JUN9_9BURK|nr:sensor domain-containing diguanylate cyclase [Rhodoferax koreense]APW37463.1 hypothetical protein RD110_09895 [Rhodoferax koreense]
MLRLVKMRRLVLALSLGVALLGAAAGTALWHVFKPMRALSEPSLQTNGFQVDQLQLQYERFLEALWAFSAGKLDAAALSFRLDIVASRLAPARQLSGISELPGPNGVLQELEKRIDAWTPVVASLSDGDAASVARAAELIVEVKKFRSQVQDMVVETNRAFSDRRDQDRLLFFARFRWLLTAVAALTLGLLLLFGVLWRQLRRSSQLGDSLAELNLTLEDRVARRTVQLQDRERQLHTILDASPIAVALLRLDGPTMLFANQRFRQQFGVSDGLEVVLPAFEAIFADPAALREFWQVYSIARGVEGYEVQLIGGAGRVWALVSARELVMDGAAVLLFWAYDISTRKELEAELRQLAHTDPLTGVLNRRAFTERSAQAIAAAQRHGRPLAVLMLDIDHFKVVNDSHGHAAGDLAIQQVAEVSLRSLRAIDLLGRLGGEEFSILLPETGAEEALATAERLRAAIAQTPVLLDGLRIMLTVSIGLSSLAAQDDDQALYRRADAALYQAKRAGRNRVVVADISFSDSRS